MMRNENQVIDKNDGDNTTSESANYNVISYGVDFDIDGIVKRMEREDIFIPYFQREFVWDIKQSSRFIESLLLGLPVPGIFLAQETESNRLLIIDGQQRLKSLLFFYKGDFNASKPFRLKDVIKKYEGKSYKTLEAHDRRNLDDSIIHATVVKQSQLQEEDTSLYHIYERMHSQNMTLPQWL